MILALDRERFISSEAVGGLARRAVGTYPPEIAEADPALAPWPYDVREAARLLDEAGWIDTDGDGLRERGGRPFSFVLIHPAGTQELSDRIAAWVQQSLRAIGVRMEIEKLEWRAFQERRRAHRFEAAMASVWFTPIPDQYELYHSAARETGLNYSGLADPEVDRMIEEGRRTFDPALRREIYGKLRRRIHELEPVSFLFHFTAPVLYDVRLEGLRPCPLGLFEFVPGPRSWRWAGGTQEG
jgi:peptide/nickel transport system substrate-binding protein